MTILLGSIKELKETLLPLRNDRTIALVPTMGNLHVGHLSLVKKAHELADIVVVSIFVNPTQFGVGEDLDSYPRTLEADISKLEEAEVDYVFVPTVEDMYPVLPPPTQVLAGNISQVLCGQSRPTHFDGVGIVVTKLFNIVQPDIAIFGEKDWQQLAIIKQIVRDLSYDIEIISAPIIRNEAGLAQSSRNQYLTKDEYQTAPELHREIDKLANKLAKGEVGSLDDLANITNETKSQLNSLGFKVDYLEVKNQDLTPITSISKSNNWVIVVAAWLGKARLLDNQLIHFTKD